MATQKGPSEGLDSPAKKKSRGFSTLDLFEALHGTLPREFPTTLNELNEGPHAAPGVPELSVEVGEALLRMLSTPVIQFQHVIHPESREKPRYLFLAQLLAALRDGTLVLGADFEELEELYEQANDTLANAGRQLLGFEEQVKGDVSAGPMELVMLRVPEGAGGKCARDRALSLGLNEGMQAGCKAALLVEVKATAFSEHMWQALSAGIALARRNASRGSGGGSSYPASPVHVLLTDAVNWHFMCIQATAAAATTEWPAGAGGAAAEAGSSGSSAPSGLHFTLESGESFRLFNCSTLHAPVLVSGTAPADLVKVMYRLYRALYPDEDLSGLPNLLQRGDMQAKKAAQDWLAPRVEDLRRPQSVVAEAWAKATAELKAAKDKVTELDKEIAELKAKKDKVIAEPMKAQLQALQK